MIKVESGKIFYKIVIRNNKSNKVELEKFLDIKGYSNRHDILVKDSGKFDHKFCPIDFKIKDGFINLLFITEFDSDRFYDFIGGFFEHGN